MEYYKYDIATLDTLADKYVDFSTAQVITGVKNFSNGLRLKSSQILTGVSGSSNTLVTLDTYNELHEIVTDQETLINNNTSDIATLKSKVNSFSNAEYPYGFTSRDTSASWGYLNTNNGYTLITDWDADGCAIGFWGKNSQLSMQVNGDIYVKKGNYQVVSKNNINSAIGSIHLPVYVNENGQVQTTNYPLRNAFMRNSSTTFSNTSTSYYQLTLNNGNDYPCICVISAIETSQEGQLIVGTSSSTPTKTTPFQNTSTYFASVSGENAYHGNAGLSLTIVIPSQTTYYLYYRYVKNGRAEFFRGTQWAC